MRKSLALLGIIALILPLVFLGCGNGSDGSPGTSKGTISGTVTNSATGTGLEGATVKTSPDQGTATTAADGSYSLTIPAGVYTITYERNGFVTQTDAGVSILAGVSMTTDKTLIATAPVIVDVAVTGTADPGGTVTATATPMVLDGSTVQSIVWSQKNSVTVTIADTTAMTTDVTLPGLTAYKDELIKVLAEPPAGGTLPAGVPLPPVTEEEYSGGLQNRTYVVALNPYALEEAGLVTLEATVTTTSGTYVGEGEISAALPWPPTTGLNSVPVNVPVILHGWSGTTAAPQTSWNWTITGGTATFDNAASQNPSFIPAAAGVYAVTETVSGVSFDVVAGTWQGAITGEDANGRPISSTCAPACHGTTGPNSIVTTIFGEWKETGHAEIFTQNMDDPAGHWSLSCALCHGVGYDTAAVNNGWDEAMADEGWTVPHPGPGTWAGILADYPETARLANIQCENCHGPNNSVLHADGILMDSERESLSSDLCGSCHGEPARHGRYQQWQLSGHASYDLAISRGLSDDCGRCHSGNGFIQWGKDFDFSPDNTVTVTWNDNTVHPQTCAACHDPHDIGTVTGEVPPGNSKVRIMGDTPVLLAGFQALNVGRGALCMTCHNSRNGLTNDNYVGSVAGAPMTGEGPHHGAQGDMLMGQNVFFVETGAPGKHALILNTCVECHMQKTPPPADLAYQLGGTNHTFVASPTICSECHDSVTAEGVQGQTSGQIDALATSLAQALENQINAFVANGNTVVLNPTSDNVTLTIDNTVLVVSYGSSHGAQGATISVDGTNFTAQIDAIEVDGTAFSQTGAKAQIIVKGGWNYLMAVDDSSLGVHNPSFILNMLAATQDQLNATDFTTL